MKNKTFEHPSLTFTESWTLANEIMLIIMQNFKYFSIANFGSTGVYVLSSVSRTLHNFCKGKISAWEYLFQLGTTVSGATLTRGTVSKICCFPFMYLSKECMNLNGAKWLVDSRADTAIRYNLDQVRYCWLDYITYWVFVFNINISSHDVMGWKCMDNKSQVLSNICFDAGYIISFIYLESVHWVKSVQIRSFLWSVFSRIHPRIRSISPYSVRMRENTEQKKLRIWTLFTQWWLSYLP